MNSSSSQPNRPTMPVFEPTLYTGIWHEIAKLPNLFEIGCTNAIANYTWNAKSGQLFVENTCLNVGRVVNRINGVATVPDPSNYPARLQVRFSSVPGPPGDYWIHYTDYNYISVVGGRSSSSLFILSRCPSISSAELQKVLNFARDLGYNTDMIVINRKTVEE